MARSNDPVVLIVEDEIDLASLYADWLEDDYEVRVATDGEEALDRVDATVDVVLLDRRLPGQSGDEVLGRIRERELDCQVAMVSAVDPDFDLLRLDIDDYLTKPVEQDQLQELVERLHERAELDTLLDRYLSLAAKKRALMAEKSESELTDTPEYDRLESELVGRRRQIESVLSRIEGAELRPTDAPNQSKPDTTTGRDARESDVEHTGPPLYRSRKIEFYFLWLAAVLSYGLGDTVSTLVAVTLVPGLIEGNPIVASVLDSFGLYGFLLIKIVVFLILLSISVQGAKTDDRFSYYWPPILTTGVGLLLTGWNTLLIVGVL